MGLKTIPFRKLDEHTEDIFEAVTVVARRARQIVGDRYIIQEELRREDENMDEIGGENELPAFELDDAQKEEFDKVQKPTTQSIDELLGGELKWEFHDEPDVDQDSGKE